MESAILQSIDIFTFEGMVTQKKNEQNEEYVLFKHNDGTETCIFKNDKISINESNDEYVKICKNCLINKWKKQDNIGILEVKNKKGDTVKSLVDFNIVDELKHITWSLIMPCNKFYIQHGKTKTLDHYYLHEYILRLNNIQKPDDGKTYSVDHINRDTLDNRLENLRWATQSEQNQNTDKRERKHNARELPDGITQKDMPKYVTYNEEIYNKEKNLKRNYFRIEKHPSLTNSKNKSWTSSKSNNISIKDKLAEAYKKLQDLGDTFDHIPDFVQSSTRDPEFMAEEQGFILKRSMMPQYVNFVKETDKRGCKFEVAIPNKQRTCTSGSKGVKLEDKFNAMLQLREQALNDS